MSAVGNLPFSLAFTVSQATCDKAPFTKVTRFPGNTHLAVLPQHPDNQRLIVRDNGIGLTKAQLQDWATYRKSHARRDNCKAVPALKGDQLRCGAQSMAVDFPSATSLSGLDVRPSLTPLASAGIDFSIATYPSSEWVQSRLRSTWELASA